MPAVNPAVLVDQLIDAIHQSGAVAAYISQTVRTHPRKFIVSYEGNTISIWIYIWTLTHGGRVSLPNEYRIQMTSVDSPLRENPDGYTVLLGYHPDYKMFAGFDLDKHKTFTPGSSSVQVGISAIQSALQNGLSFTIKDNDEIAIGIRPDQLLNYCLYARQLHAHGADTSLNDLLNRAVELQSIPEHDIDSLAADRKRLVESVTRFSRDANFRNKVLNAYQNRCAVTRFQLRLVDAAHILPVPSEDSSDHVTNGIALSPTLHRAYDNCLIYLDEDYIMRINDEKVEELISSRLTAGLEQFRAMLNNVIHLPADRAQRPNIKYIRLANKYRRIPGY